MTDPSPDDLHAPAPAGAPRPSEAPLIARLRRHFPPSEYAVITGVPDRTGGAARVADALVMSLWQSRGLDLHGIEVKTSRGDWLRELRAPDKADQIAQHCDRFWLLVSDPSIVADGELPGAWGLLAPAVRGQGLRVVTPAQRLDPEPMTRSFLASILRRYVGQTDPVTIADTAYRQGHEKARLEGERKLREARTTEQYERLTHRQEAAIAEFRDATGIDPRYAITTRDDRAWWDRMAPLLRAIGTLHKAADWTAIEVADRLDTVTAALSGAATVLRALEVGDLNTLSHGPGSVNPDD